MHEGVTLPPHPETFTPDTARAVLLTGDSSGRLYYDVLVGVPDHPVFWGSGYATRQGYDLPTAQAGLGDFMRVVGNNYADAMGLSRLPADRDLTGLSTIRSLVFDHFKNGAVRLAPGDVERYGNDPYLFYQKASYYGEEPARQPQIATKPEFLHFGSMKDKATVVLAPKFAAPIRAYLNPSVNYTGRVAAEICQGFLDAHGYLPAGKFMEDATAVRTEDRDDRLLFRMGSPEDLRDVVRIIRDVQARYPQAFDGRKGILLGEPVVVDGQELPTVRLAQEPSGNRSFHDTVLAPLQAAVHDVFTRDDNPREPTADQLDKFIVAAKHRATEDGWQEDRMAFLAAQDMTVIDNAVAAASQQ